jgi:plastocyanin
MHFSTKALLLPLFTFARAQQYGGGPADTSATSAVSETKTSSSSPGVQTVTVGENNQFAFSPDTITAAVGSSIEFVFFPPLHSVTQSTFDSPCAPIANGTGFWSGAITTTSGQNANVFTLVVNDTNPIWFFCATPTHCGIGMAGVINPPYVSIVTFLLYPRLMRS